MSILAKKVNQTLVTVVLCMHIARAQSRNLPILAPWPGTVFYSRCTIPVPETLQDFPVRSPRWERCWLEWYYITIHLFDYIALCSSTRRLTQPKHSLTLWPTQSR